MRELELVQEKKSDSKRSAPKRKVRVRYPGKLTWSGSFCTPPARPWRSCARWLWSCWSRFHALLRQILPSDRREAARRTVCKYFQDLRGAPPDRGRRPHYQRRDRRRIAPLRLHRIARQLHRLVSGRVRMATSRSFPARIRISTRRPASSSSPAAGSRRSSPCATTPRAANTSSSRSSSPTFRPQPREAPAGEVRRYPEGAGRRGHFGRGQAFLPAPGLRPPAHHQSRLRGSEGGPQGAGRFHAEPATGDECSGWIRRSAGRASWPS